MTTSPSALSRSFLAAAVLALVFTACDRPPPPSAVEPDFIADQQAVSFEACPLVANGQPVPGVTPDQRTLTIENIGKSTGTVTMTITGPGKDLFSIVQDTVVDTLAPGSQATIAIQFKPVAGGAVSAQLEIDDGVETTDVLAVALSGTGSSLPPMPTLEVAYQDQVSEEMIPCTPSQGGVIDNCTATFPTTFFADSSARKITVKNNGCAPMSVTGIGLAEYFPDTPLQFTIDQPGVLPTEESPMIVPGSGGTLDIVVGFSPAEQAGDEGSGNRLGLLTLKTNSENSPTAYVAVTGWAEVPSGYVTPTFCDFTDPASSCAVDDPGGSGKKVFSFRIHNGGNTDITVQSISIRPLASGRFTIGPRNPTGAVIPPADFVWADVTYTDAPLYVTDIVEVVTMAGTAKAGTPTIRVSGGVLPHIKVNPDPTLDFSTQATTVSVLPVEICNEPGSGDLYITNLSVQQNAAFFKILNAPAPGTIVAAGACISVDIQFTRPISGGLQTGTLTIESNDPDWGPPSHKKINLVSNQTLNEIPVAVILGPGGQGPNFSYVLNTLNPKRIKVCGDQSYDPPLTSNSTPPKGIEFWQFRIGKVPQGTAPKLTELTTNGTGPNLHGQKNQYTCVDLNVDPIITGEYRVTLQVYDFSGQASGNTAQLNIIMK